jgi:hypothetical protein
LGAMRQDYQRSTRLSTADTSVARCDAELFA